MPAFWGTALRTALLAIPLGRYVLDLGFQALGRRWLPLAGALGVTPSSAAVTFTKWREACWRMATYCFLTALGAATCAGEPWIRDTRLLWAGWPLGQHHSPMLQFWYAVEFGLYLYCVADLLLWEASRGDYWAMLLVRTPFVLGGLIELCFQAICGTVLSASCPDARAPAPRRVPVAAAGLVLLRFSAGGRHHPDDQRLCCALCLSHFHSFLLTRSRSCPHPRTHSHPTLRL